MKKMPMATIALIAVLGALLSIAGSTQQAADPGVLLRAAIEKEEVDGDLQGAIVLYRQIIASYGKNAAVAAKALYRLGQCHERLGNREAQNAYHRLIDEYPGQKEEVAMARARLAALGATAAEASRKPTFRKIRIPANPGNGVLSPDGKRFAFVSQGSVWVVPIPGKVQPDLAGEPVRLTEPIDAFNVGNTMTWSGDGKWIAFNVWNKEGLGLYVVSSEGGEPTKIAVSRSGQSAFGGRVSLSEDGRRLVFSSMDNQVPAANPTEMSYFLYAVPVRGGTASRLTDFWSYQPAFSPDGRRIAFARPIAYENGRVVKQDLWIIKSDGSAPLRLTDSPGRLRGPVWSPDGRMIAFNHQPPGGDSSSRQIWIVRVPADGKVPGEPTRIELPHDNLSMLAGWTANNNIGILMANPWHRAIYTVPARGGKATQVTPEDPNVYPLQPRWSPDGRALCLRWGAGSIVSIPAQGGELKVVHDANKTRVIAGTPGGGYGISPDGKTIVFMAGKKGSQPLEVSIWTAPVAGGEPKQITQSPSPTQDRYPCWSPDGKSVAFLRYKPGAAPIPQIFVTSSNGGAARQITSEYNKVGLGSIDWSPDGKTIAYFSRDNTINLIPAEGGEHKVLLGVGSFNRNWFSDLAWSPDGNELAYTSADRLMVVFLKSGQTREVQTGVLEKGVQDFFMDWSPDGSKLAFSAGFGGDEELWLMEDFLHLIKGNK
jgi:Tol biopolymer transport system component